MDYNQLEDMQHCTNDLDATTDCGVYTVNNVEYYQYSWDKSLIREYLNGEFLGQLEEKIGNDKIIPMDICKDRSIGGQNGYNYDGSLKNEVLGVDGNCQSGYVTDKVRLITLNEFGNLKISDSWVYDGNNRWWAMNAVSFSRDHFFVAVDCVEGISSLATIHAHMVLAVRPVITIKK